MRFTREGFVEACIAALDEVDQVLAVRDVVEAAIADPDAIDRELGEPTGWIVEDLHVSEHLTIQRIVWGPGVRVAPHEHRMWAAAGVYRGREEQTLYRRSERALVSTGGVTLDEGGVQLLGAEAIHAVLNPLCRFTTALHVYGGDLNSAERCAFDVRTGAARTMDRTKSDSFTRLVAERQSRDSGPWTPERTLKLQMELYPLVYN